MIKKLHLLISPAIASSAITSLIIASRVITSLAVASLLMLPSPSANAAPVPSTTQQQSMPDAKQIKRIITDADIFSDDSPVSAAVSGNNATISVYSDEPDKDMKIDAVLCARAIMDATHNKIIRVCVAFWSYPGAASCKTVDVTSGDIKAYGTGAISKEELLSSLEIVQSQSSQTSRQFESWKGIPNGTRDPSGNANTFPTIIAQLHAGNVVPGYRQMDRREILNQLNDYQKSGLNVQRLFLLLANIEVQIGHSGNTTIDTLIDDLQRRVDLVPVIERRKLRFGFPVDRKG